MASRRSRAGRLTGALVAASAIVGQVTLLFFPTDQRGTEETLRGSLHPPLTAVMSLFIVLAMIAGATSQGKRFLLYSIATILMLLVFGALAGRDAPRLEAGEPTPWLGVLERINVYAYVLWMPVLATSLTRGSTRAHSSFSRRDRRAIDGRRHGFHHLP